MREPIWDSGFVNDGLKRPDRRQRKSDNVSASEPSDRHLDANTTRDLPPISFSLSNWVDVKVRDLLRQFLHSSSVHPPIKLRGEGAASYESESQYLEVELVIKQGRWLTAQLSECHSLFNEKYSVA